MKNALFVLLICSALLCACGAQTPTAAPEPTQVAITVDTPKPQPTATPIPPIETSPPLPAPTEIDIAPTETPTSEPAPTIPLIEVMQNEPYIPDGRFEQKLDIYRPTEGEGPFPTLFMIHGGGGRKEELAVWGRSFGEKGYAAVSIEHRQWPDYDYPDPVEDAFCALAWVHANAAEYGFDPQNIFVMGHSAGGTLAAMLGTVDDPALYLTDCPYSLPSTNWVRGVIPFTGIFNYADAVERAPTLNDYASDLLGGELDEAPETWAEASPETWIDGSEPPFLIIHGGGDGSISPGNSEAFAQALEAAGVEVELLIVPGAKHTQITKSEESLQAVGAFLERLLATPQTSSPSESDAVASLKNLPLDEFFEESFNQLLLRNPETLTEMNLSAEFGLRNDQLANLSDAYIRETQQLEAAILGLLQTYDRDELSREQQISYDVYEWYLDNQVRGHEFMYNDYPLHHFIRSYHFNLDALFGEIHPLSHVQDVEDFISRLAQVDGQAEQLLEGLKLREETGVIPPKFIIDLAKTDMRNYLQMRSPDPSSIKAEALPIYIRFIQILEEMDELNAEEKQAFQEAALVEIKESFIPGYLKLINYLDYLQPLATNDAGAWKLPNGDAYYAHMLRQETSTDLTSDQIHELGLAEVERIQAELRAAFAELGYPENASLGELMGRAIDDGGYYSISNQAGKDEYVAAIETILDEANQRTYDYFDLRPEGEVILVTGPMGGYYVPGTPDGSRPGAYHVGTVGSWRPKFNMQTIAYHEAIPGHHFQIALAQEMDLPSFRNHVTFNGYVEGWALYAERLAQEMGLYDDSPYGNIGRLQLELLRAVRLVTDTGIHAKEWTREEAKAYMRKALGDEQGRWGHEVERYIVLPAQATGYKIGMIKILELRQKAMDQLGDQFEIKEFHNVVLGNGSLPLDILEQVVDEYIEAKLTQ